jgi:hypothetical protein
MRAPGMGFFSLEPMLIFMILGMLCVPVAAGDVAVEAPIAAMISAMALDRLRAWIRRSRNRIAAKQWQSAGLMACKVPKKPDSAKKRARASPPCNNTADGAAPPEVPDEDTAPVFKRAAIDPDARDPKKPWNPDWLEQEDIKDHFVQVGGHVHCATCMRAKVASKFVRGNPVDDKWELNQLTQHLTNQKHREPAKAQKQDVQAASALKSGRLRALQALKAPVILLMTLVYWLCVENIAMLKLASLYAMIMALPIVSGSSTNPPGNYVNT